MKLVGLIGIGSGFQCNWFGGVGGMLVELLNFDMSCCVFVYGLNGWCMVVG